MADTIPVALRVAAHQFGAATALAEPGGLRLTYRQVHDLAHVVARSLIASGIEPGGRVAIWAPNTHHWVLGALGSLYAGATLVPVNTRYTGTEALDVIERSRARVLLVAGPFLGTDRGAELARAADEADASLPELIVTIPVEPSAAGSGGVARPHGPAGAGASRLAGVCERGSAVGWTEFVERGAAISLAAADERAAMISPDDVSDILFTSGTTGRSKGAMSAHRQSLDVARAWAACAELTSADRYLIVNPFFHSFGYKAGILACLLTGATMVPQRVYDAGQAIGLIESERITVFPGAPTIYTSMLDHPGRAAHDLSSLRLAVTGAAVVPVPLVERMRDELGFDVVLTAYGLTEAVVATMCRPGDDPQTVAHTSGRATAGFEITIATPDRRATPRSRGDSGGSPPVPAQSGEILLRGPNVMLGYLDDPEATAEAIDTGGWLHTGDIGQLDERGYLTITDRLKDMYICGGFNVYPAEVEQALARHPRVAESAVIGVPDERLGEAGKAFVVLRPGSGPEQGQGPGDGQPTEAELIDFCRERLANYKVPRLVEFRSDLPRNPAGKPLKRLLRQESA